MTIFVPGKKKRARNLPFAYMGVHISCKMMHSRMHNAMARSGLETKFLRRRFMRKGNSSIATMNLLARKIWSNFFYFYICYHAGGSTKHLPRPEVKRRKEESSPKDALTPKEGKTRFAGKMRTYLWACPVTPTPQPPTPSSFPLPL